MPLAARVVLLDERPDGPRLVPSAPLGRWVMRPMTKLLRALEPGALITLDLARSPVSRPRHVATVLWLEGQADLLGLDLAVEAPDMVSGELLAFSGLDVPVRVVEPARADKSAAAL